MGIALLGFGTVGYGVYELISEKTDMQIKYVLDLFEHPEISAVSTTDINDILSDEEIDTVIEVIGREHPAFEYIEASLKAGKNVVTANKLVVCKNYDYLTELAIKNGVALRYTAAAGGGIPWLVNLERLNRIDSVLEINAILNGTTNFILDKMYNVNTEFAEALAEAQRLGYAEADPSSDIDGLDTLRKIVLSANIAFGISVKNETFDCVGIGTVKKEDIVNADKNGRVCRLLAKTKMSEDGKLGLLVEPVLFKKDSPFASVRLNFNRIEVVSSINGVTAFYGYGAGRYPTAQTVVGDCMDIYAGVKKPYSKSTDKRIADNTFIKQKYYVRVKDVSALPSYMKTEKFGSGYITDYVTVSEMHKTYKKLNRDGNECFIAALGE